MTKTAQHAFGWVAAAMAAAFIGAPAVAEEALSFEDAAERLLASSDALAASEASTEAARAHADAVRLLNHPQVDLEARVIESRKSVDVSLAPLRPFLDAVPLPGIELPNNLHIVDDGVRFRPQLSMNMPLYSGGQIPAAQRAARASVDQAQAEGHLTEQRLRTRLVELYFGEQLARRVAAARRQTLASLDHHLHDAEASERQGFLSRAQRMQVQVARDEAARDLEQADSDERNASVALANYLRLSAAPQPSSPLFVLSGGVGALDDYLAAAARHAQLAALDAVERQSAEAERAARAASLPQAYMFGQYDLYPEDATIVEPDWVIGVGVRYRLFASTDRSDEERAAAERRAQARAAQRQARSDIETGVTAAYNDANAAAREFSLFASSIALAQENLRLQTVSFREGVATASDVVDAQLAATRAEVGRAQAAYRFDVALARLLAASGQAEQFQDYMMRADQVISP